MTARDLRFPKAQAYALGRIPPHHRILRMTHPAVGDDAGYTGVDPIPGVKALRFHTEEMQLHP